jgi:tetratricopeptide (TPR) repeat protein
MNETPNMVRVKKRASCLPMICVVLSFFSLLSVHADDLSEKQRPYSKEAVEHYNRAVELHLHNSLPEAASEYLEAVKADGRLEEAWSNLGVLYFNRGKFKDALEAYKKAIALNSNRTLNFYGAGLTYKALGDKEHAIESWKKALSIDPKFRPAYKNLQDLGITPEPAKVEIPDKVN